MGVGDGVVVVGKGRARVLFLPSEVATVVLSNCLEEKMHIFMHSSQFSNESIIIVSRNAMHKVFFTIKCTKCLNHLRNFVIVIQ